MINVFVLFNSDSNIRRIGYAKTIDFVCCIRPLHTITTHNRHNHEK